MNTIIVAMDDDRVIGNKGKLPWHNAEDLKAFKDRTVGHCVVMGRNTFDSLPEKFKPLPCRVNIVVSTIYSQVSSIFRMKYETADSKPQVFPALEPALEYAHQRRPGQEVFIIGGARIYQTALEKGLVDRILISRIPGEHEGDAFFPELDDSWVGRVVEQYETFDVWEHRRE